MFGRWQEAPFRLKTTTGTKQKVSNTHCVCVGGEESRQSKRVYPTMLAAVCVCVRLPLFPHTVEECVLTDGGLDTSGWAATEHSRCKCRSPCRSATLRPHRRHKHDGQQITVCVCVWVCGSCEEAFTWTFMLDFYGQLAHKLQRQFHDFLD